MSDSVRPHRQQPTRLPRPWDSPGKNIGVGCHFLLHCMKVKSESEVAQSFLTLSNLMDCSPPGSSVHGIFQARVLEWGATAFSSSHPQATSSHLLVSMDLPSAGIPCKWCPMPHCPLSGLSDAFSRITSVFCLNRHGSSHLIGRRRHGLHHPPDLGDLALCLLILSSLWPLCFTWMLFPQMFL